MGALFFLYLVKIIFKFFGRITFLSAVRSFYKSSLFFIKQDTNHEISCYLYNMIEIDGSKGEGGGQVLRSALTLSLVTLQEFRITGIRSRRPKPGLQPQHLKAVEASAEISRATTRGAMLGSTELFFSPSTIQGGRYRFDIGTAGATTLVLQTIFLPLCLAERTSSITLIGGTHVPWSPCYHYLELHWLHFMKKIGCRAELFLDQAGFFPKGGGVMRSVIYPTDKLSPITLTERGKIKQIRGISAVANLDRSIAERQRNRVVHRLGHRYPLNDIRIVNLPSRFKGSILLLIAEFAKSQCCYFGLGELGKPSEKVADEAIDAFEEFMETDGVIDQYLADQLLLPLALAAGNSTFRTSKVTNHLVTNAAVIRYFLPVSIEIDAEVGKPGLVSISSLGVS